MEKHVLRIGRTAWVLALMLVSGLAFVAAQPERRGSPVEVLARGFVGTYIDDITFTGHGPHGNEIVAAMGDGLYGMPVNSRSGASLRKIVDFRTQIARLPSGLTSIEDQQVFAAREGSTCASLLIFNPAGRLVERRAIHRLAGSAPPYCEGLAYIPRTSPVYPGHLLSATMDAHGGPSRIEILTTDGQVVHEIQQIDPADPFSIGGVSFLRPDRILIGVNFRDKYSEIRTIDFSGAEVAPRAIVDHDFIEGLAQVADGRIFATFPPATLHAYDENLQRLPADDRDYQLGFGLVGAGGITWDPDTNRLLVSVRDGIFGTRTIHAFPDTLDSATQVVDLRERSIVNPGGLTYLAPEGLTAVANSSPLALQRRIYLYAGDAPAGEVALSTGERSAALEYLPRSHEFAVRVLNDPTRVRIFTRHGVLVRLFDPRPPGVDAVGTFAHFEDATGAGRLLFMMSGDRGVVTDLAGTRIAEFNWRTDLGVMSAVDVTYITSGQYAGAFAVTEGQTGSITFFRLRP